MTIGNRILKGTLSVLGGDAYGHILRLIANLIMTRLLMPEAFGLLLIVNLVQGALQMLSDVGIRGALITKRDFLDDEYIDTAWTISIIRGIALCVVGMLVALPVAYFYSEPQLTGLLLLSSVAPLLTGFCSPFPILEEKKVKLLRVIAWKSLAQTVAVVATIVWLLIHPTVWALAANGVISALVLSVSSFLFFRNRMPKLTWNREAVRAIVQFGKWVFLATALTFFARHANLFIMSKWVTTSVLGVFSIAVGLVKLVENVPSSITFSLLLPVYAELGKGEEAELHKHRIRIKVALFGLAVAPVVTLSVFGAEIISLLYAEEYHSAGWMLEVMSVGSLALILSASVENIPHSLGNSYLHMWLQFYRGALMLLSMCIGGLWFGLTGLIIGISAGSFVFLPVLSYLVRQYGIRDYVLDISLISGGLGLIYLGWWTFGFPVQTISSG